jgi:RHS repeat-associated protein
LQLGDKPVVSDAAGRLVQDAEGRVYHYDLFGRLQRVQTAPQPGPLGQGAETHLRYDALGRLVKLSQGPPNCVQMSCLAVSAPMQHWGQHTVRIQQIGAPEALRITDDEGNTAALLEGNAFRHAHLGHAGRIQQLTGSQGEWVHSYQYSAFGRPLATDAVGQPVQPSLAQSWLHGGQPYLFSLDLQHFGARWYRPSWGRFIIPDPLGYVDGPNRYSYSGAQPLEFTDFSGLIRCDPKGGARLSFHMVDGKMVVHPASYYDSI